MNLAVKFNPPCIMELDGNDNDLRVLRLFKVSSPGKDDVFVLAPDAAEAVAQVDDAFAGCESIQAAVQPLYIRGCGSEGF